MLESKNPFADPEFKKQILAGEGITSPHKISEAEILGEEDLVPVDDDTDFKSLIKSAPQIPATAKNIIADASLLAKNEREKASQEMKLAISEVFSRYNKEYGLDLNINLDNLSESLVMVSSPEKRRVLELYVSECFNSVKPILLLHLLQKLVLICDYILKPENLMSNQLSIPDLFLVVEKLQGYIINLNDIINETTVKDSDKLLDKLAEEKHDSSLNSPESKENVERFMKLFNTEQSLKKKE